VLLTAVSEAAAPPFQVWDGTPLFTTTQTLHVGGTPLKARLIKINDHPMGCGLVKFGCPGPVEMSFWMQTGNQEANCHHWYSAVSLMESARPNATPYPYLELVTQGGQIWTDEGLWVYPPGLVTCNGALDWTK